MVEWKVTERGRSPALNLPQDMAGSLGIQQAPASKPQTSQLLRAELSSYPSPRLSSWSSMILEILDSLPQWGHPFSLDNRTVL
ncbi:hypothetical protein N7509_009393 [Penicillium cosmopolitanum]|uniref:Uncharacterized protein n=1 Tax=Penicillium cosmopolitanum TaxID=1131564 RepID=A0A9W9VPD2_9EURO|nr:uncharacterized protein N7509_009393 [Penicillium cosmopolitanum]KAJ5386852.1 hypothetical protein N7509_009393 [Penicillium cosmopolitanum]